MIFDLHTHISLKVMLGGTSNDNRNDCWAEISSPILDIVSGGILGSQSSLTQMKSGGVKLAIAPLYSLEHAFSKNFLLADFIPKIEKQLSKSLLQKIKNDEISPFELLKQELELIIASQKNAMKIVYDVHDFDIDKINIVLACEGPHNFQNKYIGKNDILVQDILINFKSFITQNRVLYTGMAHLTRNPICTHSYAMKLIADKQFVPEGGGLTDAAKQMIDICYSGRYNGKHTLIDIKHMSLAARLQFYNYRDQKGYNHIPIVASHMACTGMSCNNIKIFKPKNAEKYSNVIELKYHKSYSDVVFKYTNSPQLEYVAFNPWGLNLYNEEIYKIIDSNGIIGVILDLRVLGAKGKNFGNTSPEGIEYMSLACYTYLKNQNRLNIQTKEDIEEEEEEEIEFDSIVAGKDAMHFFANILHIVKVYFDRYQSLKAWDHICVGSDSDGLIQPIDDYESAADYGTLKAELIAIFDAERKREKFKKYFGLLSSIDLAERIFYTNGTRFINNNL